MPTDVELLMDIAARMGYGARWGSLTICDEASRDAHTLAMIAERLQRRIAAELPKRRRVRKTMPKGKR